MNWKDYSYLKSNHAFLSPSKYHWLNYNDAKLIDTYRNYERVRLGTQLHKLAEDLIRLNQRLPDTAAALNCFVNDAIGFRMTTEQTLFYSANCYGTADAISYRDGVLRIHDLKTGKTPGSMNQLLIYAALFCLDYKEEPKKTFLKIYQDEEFLEYSAPLKHIRSIMERIIEADKVLEVLAKY